MHKGSIKTKLILVMTLLVLVPSLLMAFIAYRSSHSSMIEEYKKLGNSIGHELTHSTNILLEKYDKDLGLLSTEPSVLAYDGSEESRGAVYSSMSQFLSSSDSDFIVYSDTDGNAIYQTSDGARGSFSASDQDWFNKTLESEGTHPVSYTHLTLPTKRIV